MEKVWLTITVMGFTFKYEWIPMDACGVLVVI